MAALIGECALLVDVVALTDVEALGCFLELADDLDIQVGRKLSVSPGAITPMTEGPSTTPTERYPSKAGTLQMIAVAPPLILLLMWLGQPQTLKSLYTLPVLRGE